MILQHVPAMGILRCCCLPCRAGSVPVRTCLGSRLPWGLNRPVLSRSRHKHIYPAGVLAAGSPMAASWGVALFPGLLCWLGFAFARRFAFLLPSFCLCLLLFSYFHPFISFPVLRFIFFPCLSCNHSFRSSSSSASSLSASSFYSSSSSSLLSSLFPSLIT